MGILTERDADLLRAADLENLLDEAQQNGEVIYQQTGSELQVNLPRQFGSGSDREIRLRNGLTLILRDARLWQSVRLEGNHGQSPPLIFKFQLSSNSRVLTPGIPEIQDDYTEVAGCNYLYHLPEVTEFEEWYKNEAIQLIVILIETDTLREFGTGFEHLPQPLQRLIQGDRTARFHQPIGKTTAAMQQVLDQVLRCPYQGVTRQMYLESKALELLTLQFTQWSENRQTFDRALQKAARKLRAEDIDRLHQAKEILILQMDNPPSLLSLAWQVGLDDCKLKWGFRRVFGTTVFGYLHDYRMERSRQVLTIGQMIVTEVAFTVGYSSLPSFSKAFHKRYGSSPIASATQLRLG